MEYQFKAGDVLKIIINEQLYTGYTQRQFIGRCIALKKKGIATTIILRIEVKGISLEQKVYIYSPAIISVRVLKKFGNFNTKKKKLYFLRLKKHKRKNKIF